MRCSAGLKLNQLERDVCLVPGGSTQLGLLFYQGLAEDSRDDCRLQRVNLEAFWQQCIRSDLNSHRRLAPGRANLASAAGCTVQNSFPMCICSAPLRLKIYADLVDWQLSSYHTMKVETSQAMALIHWQLKATEPNFLGSFLNLFSLSQEENK